MLCERQFPGCKNVAEGRVSDNFVCKNCLENGEKKEFVPFSKVKC